MPALFHTCSALTRVISSPQASHLDCTLLPPPFSAPQYDIFRLQEATQGRALSVLAYALVRRYGLVKMLGLDAARLVRWGAGLACLPHMCCGLNHTLKSCQTHKSMVCVPRFLVRVEEGYQANDYHNRTHAADVLRNMHCIATRGGLLEMQSQPKQLEQQPAGQEGNGGGGRQQAGQGLSHGNGLMLLSAYVAAVVHDFEHMGGCPWPAARTSDTDVSVTPRPGLV